MNTLIDKMNEINTTLLNKVKKIPTKELIRTELEKVGFFLKVNKMDQFEIDLFSKDKPLVGIDGSYVVVGKNPPYTLLLGQALAKSTKALDGDNGILKADVFTELTNNENSEFQGLNFASEVTKLEVTVANESFFKYNPFLIMFDGGFWRLEKEAELLWDSFKKMTLSNSLPIVGVIEDIGSYEFWDLKINNEINIPENIMLDSVLLFNVLDIGEIFVFNTKLFRNKYIKTFARFSEDPLPIACDFLLEQKNIVIDTLRFIYSITPSSGRGIPLWIDIVDNEVKITKEMTDLLIENCLDYTVVEKYFTGKRNKR